MMKIAWYRRQSVWVILSFLFMLVIFLHSMKTGTGAGRPSSIKQVIYNFAHVPAYMVLTILLFNAIRSQTLTWAIFVSAAYGVFIEYVQSFNPGRTASVMDEGLNVVGIVIAVMLIRKGMFNFTKR
ncbi:MAG: VanZ family protein [Candidatus Omnitrophica bacterium]|nr:VanZ family protein [Candidatus Omnitrophota bacterium]MCA9407341.1 VanZ family protein [Candidatus Omnitrophota bacterium]